MCAAATCFRPSPSKRHAGGGWNFQCKNRKYSTPPHCRGRGISRIRSKYHGKKGVSGVLSRHPGIAAGGFLPHAPCRSARDGGLAFLPGAHRANPGNVLARAGRLPPSCGGGCFLNIYMRVGGGRGRPGCRDTAAAASVQAVDNVGVVLPQKTLRRSLRDLRRENSCAPQRKCISSADKNIFLRGGSGDGQNRTGRPGVASPLNISP